MRYIYHKANENVKPLVKIIPLPADNESASVIERAPNLWNGLCGRDGYYGGKALSAGDNGQGS